VAEFIITCPRCGEKYEGPMSYLHEVARESVRLRIALEPGEIEFEHNCDLEAPWVRMDKAKVKVAAKKAPPAPPPKDRVPADTREDEAPPGKPVGVSVAAWKDAPLRLAEKLRAEAASKTAPVTSEAPAKPTARPAPPQAPAVLLRPLEVRTPAPVSVADAVQVSPATFEADCPVCETVHAMAIGLRLKPGSPKGLVLIVKGVCGVEWEWEPAVRRIPAASL
jgi:hypothetical protein